MAVKQRKIIAILLTAVMLVLTAGGLNGAFRTSVSAAPAAAAEINGRKLIAQNDNYALYVNEDDLSIAVLCKANGRYMESSVSYDDGKNNKTWLGAMKSALVLNLIYSNVDTKQADLINDDVTKKITYNDAGFSADVYWSKYKIGMTLKVTLNDDGVTAEIPDESITESDSGYYIGSISMYQYMGNTYLGEKEGYMLIPDGNGALIYLDNKEGRFNSGYSATVYGTDQGFVDSEVVTLLWDKYETLTDANKVSAPVFGMAHTAEGIAYLAVIEEGAERAAIEAYPNGVSIDYNRVYARFIQRRLYNQPTGNTASSSSIKMTESDRSHSDLKIRYIFLSGDNADYCGMANAYRSYLLANGGLSVKEDSYHTRIDFLGTERENWVIGTSAVVMTTIDDIREIYGELKAEGVTDILSVYKGWQKGGLYNVPIKSYSADSKIGGTKKLTALMKELEDTGVQFYLYNDVLRINPDEQNATFNIMKKINKRKMTEKTYRDVYEEFNILTPARSKLLISRFVKDFSKKVTARLAVAGITNNIYSYTYSNKTYTRFDCAESYADVLAKTDEDAELVLEQPFAYLWRYADAYLDMPVYTSDYIYEDESVPFLSIVLKGVIPVYSEYVNFEANKQEFLLKLVETGTYPSFYITKENSSDLIYTNSSDIYSSQYSIYKDTITAYAKELRAVNEKVSGSYIVGHEILGSGITVVTYDNGVRIYLNYGEAQASADGITLEGMTYKVVE